MNCKRYECLDIHSHKIANDANNNDDIILNIAAICPETHVLGPGVRAALWVQGCPFNCRGCISQEWRELKPNQLIHPVDLIPIIMQSNRISGLTISGGEPFLQAAGLYQLIKLMKKQKDIDVICFTGYTLDDLQGKQKTEDTQLLLSVIDVLIDGLYVEDLNNNQGMKGSTNQKVHFLTSRLSGYDFDDSIRNVELHVIDGYIQLVGIPPKGVYETIQDAVSRMDLPGVQK